MEISESRIFIAAGGHRLRAQILAPQSIGGQAPPPTLVILHDALGSIRQWREFPRALVAATGCAALIYERHGSGFSGPLTEVRSRDYLDHEARDVLPAVLAACGVERPLLVGHSDGATIALLFAAMFPVRPLGVVSIAGHVFVEEVTLQGIRAAQAAYRTTGLRDRLAKYHGDGADALFAGWSDTWLDSDFRTWDITDRLASIRCPVLALQGADDEYGTVRQVEAISRGIDGPGRAWVLADCGHAPHLQSPQEVLDGVARFVDELAAGAGFSGGSESS